ncbi:winged helix-turn-helix domain-containing protein [Thalassotalea fusca]
MEFKIGEIRVKPAHNQLIVAHQVVVLEPLAMAMLVKLAQSNGDVISRQQLMEQLWQAKVVTDNALHRIVTLLRKGLNDDPKNPKFIATVPKKGYKLIHPVEWQNKAQANGRNVKNRAFSSVFAFILLLGLVYFWQANQEITTYQFGKVQQLTSFIGVEHSAIFLPSSSDAKSSYLFVYQDEQQARSTIAMKTVDDSTTYDLVSESNQLSQLALSPSASKLAFVRSESGRCELMVANFSILEKNVVDFKMLSSCHSASFVTPQWLDDETIAFITTDYNTFNSQIMTVNVVNNNVAPLMPKRPVNADDYAFAVDPQGHRLAYIRHYYADAKLLEDKFELYLFDINTGTSQLISPEQPGNIYSINWFAEQPDTLLVHYKDGKKLLNVNGELTNIHASELNKVNRLETNSHSQILYTQYQRKRALVEYQLAQLQLSKQQVIAPSSGNEYRGSYSVDGQSIAYFSDKEHSGARLWLQKGNQQQLVNIGVEPVSHMLEWSPKDSELLMLKSKEHRLFSYHLATNELIYLTGEDEKIRRGIWGLERDVIYYVQDNELDYNIYRKNIVTQEVSELTEKGANYIQLSPDGNFLYFSIFDKKGLWRIDLSSGQKELLMPDFSEKNYEFWQCGKEGVYFTQFDNKAGLFYADFENFEVVTLLAGVDVKHFHVQGGRLLVNMLEQEEGDIYLVELVKAD